MDLREYYFNNIKSDEYHHRFFEDIKKVNTVFNIFEGEIEVNDFHFDVYDAEEAIKKFRELCQPQVYFDKEKRCWFYLITYYLFCMGYEIKEFPRLLARPPMDPSEFTYNDIRNTLIANGEAEEDGTVKYAKRRVFVANLTFEIKNSHIDIGGALEEKFVEISNRSASFDSMNSDEKLAEIANLIENLLKRNGSYITLDYSTTCFGFITDEIIKSYRGKIQCFRHSSPESIAERKTFSEKQKAFLIDYGITIVKVIHELKQRN